MSFEVEVLMIAASGIEVSTAPRTPAGTLKVLADGHLHSADPTEDCGLIPLCSRPYFNRMTG
jgi:hypothetical protein